MFYFQDMYDRNITVYFGPNMHIWKQIMLKMPHPYPQLANRVTIHNSWEEFHLDTEKVFEKESIKNNTQNIVDNNFYEFREHMLCSLTIYQVMNLIWLKREALPGTDQRTQSLLIMDLWVVDH